LRPRPEGNSRDGVARLRSASVFRRASAARVMPHVPTRGEAHSDGEAALLRLVKTLVQGLLGVGQAPQRRRPGGQCCHSHKSVVLGNRCLAKFLHLPQVGASSTLARAVPWISCARRTKAIFEACDQRLEECFTSADLLKSTVFARRHYVVERMHLRREQSRLDVEGLCAAKQTH